MTSDKGISKNHIFKGILKKYEEAIVNISLEIGKRRGQNPIIIKLLTYLLIHNKLTQKQLKELMNCSIGSISTHLAALTSINFIQKELIPGTHTNIYSLQFDITQNISSIVKLSEEYIRQAQDFLKSKKHELNDLFKKKDKNISPIFNRFEELEYVMKIYSYLIEIVSSPEKKINLKLEQFNSKELDSIQEFNPEIKQLEKEVINFFTYTPMFFSKSELFSKTFAYFITRKTLTQEKLRELTELSAGKVSQEIGTLLELEIIDIINISESGKLTYRMNSITSAFLKISFSILTEYIKWKEKLDQIYSEMTDQKEIIKTHNGYKEILNVVKIFLKAMPIYEKLYYVVKEIRSKLDN